MKKIRTWLILTAAGALALFAGGRRLSEAVVLDPDNMAGVR